MSLVAWRLNSYGCLYYFLCSNSFVSSWGQLIQKSKVDKNTQIDVVGLCYLMITSLQMTNHSRRIYKHFVNYRFSFMILQDIVRKYVYFKSNSLFIMSILDNLCFALLQMLISNIAFSQTHSDSCQDMIQFYNT